MRVLRAATGQQRDALLLQRLPRQDLRRRVAGADPLAGLRPRCARRASHMVPRPDPYRPLWTKPDGTIDTDQYIAFYDEYIDKAHGRRRGRLRAGADPGLGRLGHAAGRLLPQAPQVLRRAQDPADGRRGAHQLGPHRQVAVHGALGRRARRGRRSARGSATASRSRAWPCASRSRRSFEKISRLQQLRRQPDGLRRGAGLAPR